MSASARLSVQTGGVGIVAAGAGGRPAKTVFFKVTRPHSKITSIELRSLISPGRSHLSYNSQVEVSREEKIMRSGKSIALLTLFLAGGAMQALAQDARPKREPDVPYVPTRDELVAAMLKLGDVKKGDVLYDLGCGDGRIVITAAQKFGTRGVGIDINPVRIKEAEENARKAGVTDLVKFIEQDLFESSISDATVVTLYLLPSVNMKLRPKLLKDLKPGTRIVSHSFDMGDWKPDKMIEVEGEQLFFWVIPAK
jgi:2-polyprenyl-3-methyl-5-hydroxy-6-metoxy-1,4-benzoquinol methylase